MTDPITPHLRALDAINPHEEGIREALEHGVTAMCVLRAAPMLWAARVW